MKNRNSILIALQPVLACFALLSAQAVSPAPDGCYPNFTTAEGCNTLANLVGGAGNTGLGWYALFSDVNGNFNTAVGGGALILNTADSNTAVGTAALLLNTTGIQNTAVGTDALVLNDSGVNNTAIGYFALMNNTSTGNTAAGAFALNSNAGGTFNTAVGGGSMGMNIDGNGNTAVGTLALNGNLHGGLITAVGLGALQNCANDNNTGVGAGAGNQTTIGQGNTAVGFSALHDNVIGGGNTAVGTSALASALAGFNIGVGVQAGSAVVNAHNAICIGSPGDDLNDSCFIGNIRDVTTDLNDAVPVLIDSIGQLGTLNSSRRFKTDITPMDKSSEAILALQPVSFRYKVHKGGPAQYGLIAEDVAEVDRDLVIYDKDGKPQTVRYEAVNAMLLNEFLKEHKKVQDLQATVAQQQKGMEVLTAQLKEQAAQIQKVSAQLQVSKPAPEVVVNKP